MESIFAVVLERSFSELGKLQKEMILQYAVKMKDKSAAFQIRKVQCGNEQTETETVAGLELEKAKQIVRFLYENAVPMENWKDVLYELVCLV